MSEIPSILQVTEEEQQRFESAVAVYLGVKVSEVRRFRQEGRYPDRPAVDVIWTHWKIAVGLADPIHKDSIKPYIDPEDF